MKHHQSTNTIGYVAGKALLIALAGVCLILGLVGLVLPIIPGILFLFLGAMLLSRLSSRFAGFFNRLPGVSKWKKRGDSFQRLNATERIKLSFWIGAKSVLAAAESLWKSLRKQTRTD